MNPKKTKNKRNNGIRENVNNPPSFASELRRGYPPKKEALRRNKLADKWGPAPRWAIFEDRAPTSNTVIWNRWGSEDDRQIRNFSEFAMADW